MRYAWLVALREYLENAKAKGFWISIFMLPALLFLTIQVPIWLEEKATPIRHYVLIDQSGQFAPVIEAALDRAYQSQVLESLKEYGRRNVRRGAAPLEEIKENDPEFLRSLSGGDGREAF